MSQPAEERRPTEPTLPSPAPRRPPAHATRRALASLVVQVGSAPRLWGEPRPRQGRLEVRPVWEGGAVPTRSAGILESATRPTGCREGFGGGPPRLWLLPRDHSSEVIQQAGQFPSLLGAHSPARKGAPLVSEEGVDDGQRPPHPRSPGSPPSGPGRARHLRRAETRRLPPLPGVGPPSSWFPRQRLPVADRPQGAGDGHSVL